MTRHFLRDDDVTTEEQREILDLADEMKRDRLLHKPLYGPKNVAVLFDKTSTRTRISFSAGISELGGYPLVIDAQTSQLSKGETLEDTARVLDRQVVAIVWRTYAQARLETVAKVSSVPVVNALTDEFHPCQILADLQTIREHKGDLQGRTFAFLGDGASNMAHSYLLGCATAGLHVRIGTPEGVVPDPRIVADAERIASAHSGSVEVVHNPEEAAEGADVLATDTWVSMGKEAETAERERIFGPYALTAKVLTRADVKAIVLHCLPAYRGKEIEAAVIDGPQSVVWDEAENRLHTQKALLTWLIRQGGGRR